MAQIKITLHPLELFKIDEILICETFTQDGDYLEVKLYNTDKWIVFDLKNYEKYEYEYITKKEE